MDGSYPPPPPPPPLPPHPFHPIDESSWPEAIKTQFHTENIPHPINSAAMHSRSAADTPISMEGQPRNLKVEEEMNASDPMWHNRMSEAYHQTRHFSHPQVIPHPSPAMARMTDANMISMPHRHQWSASQSGSSTPIPLYGHAEGFNQMGYQTVPPNYPYASDPSSAVPMSPQSSQGGWASAASSDGVEQRGMMQSPMYRPPSPTLVVRSDGIRKKNARFEIPKDRNLSNIDAMILQTTDENEKKELKQQKRLLRNRQAALDSRQRKKCHTEKLEQEKKVSEKKMFDMEEALARMEDTLSIEREQWIQERQQMEHYIHGLRCEKDEAVRTQTVETGELRGQIMFLKECLAEFEARHKSFVPVTETNSFNNTFNNDYHIHDSFEDEFAFIDSDDFKMDETEQSQRQATPKPVPILPILPTNDKPEAFSWNTFYMCLLVGALLASHGQTATSDDSTTSAIASSISPTEAGAVLKAVLNKSDQDIGLQITAGDAPSQAVHSSVLIDNPVIVPTSSLETLHDELSKPSRRQELEAAFSLSVSSYNHIMDPFNGQLDSAPSQVPPKPSQLQQAYANMKAQKQEMERSTGLGARLRERSALWDQVPLDVAKNFQELVRSSAALSDTRDGEQMDL